MSLFAHAHATHPDWRMAVALAAAQIDAQRADTDSPTIRTPSLGWAYFSDHYADEAKDLLDELGQRWPGVSWVGAMGLGVLANGAEYIDEPAVALMLSDLPPEDFQVFSGVAPLGRFPAMAALVHADPETQDLPELLVELCERTRAGYLFGGLTASRDAPLQLANGLREGGLSGVAFSERVNLVSRVTQGCQPLGPTRVVTSCRGNLLLELDGQPALDCLFKDLGLAPGDPRDALPQLRETLVGVSDAQEALLSHPQQFGTDTRVRHLVGIDPQKKGVAIAEAVSEGMQLAFCRRNTEAARRDLVRICAEIREELEPDDLPLSTAMALAHEPPDVPAGRGIRGAIYISCTGRGGPHFGGPSAEMAIVRHALGDVPLVGFLAAGEIARHHLYGYTGVLTVFADATP